MIGVLIFTITALILSIIIVILNSLLFNNKTEELIKLLPGYNCGGCGYGSCSGMADELLKNKDAIEKCKMCKNKEEIYKYLGEK